MANWNTLFSAANNYECKDCMNVFSPASYLVDIMQYLDNCQANADRLSPLQVLFKRRPDIGNLLLTCPNTNTEIPYIDLVNEIMEYYVVHFDAVQKQLPPPSSSPDPMVHDTGKATTEELKAEPQYTRIDAYTATYSKVYPFTLPYHQPLDVIRSYLQFLKTSRVELMQVFSNTIDMTQTPPAITTNAIKPAAMDAEWLQLSLMEYEILTGKDFNGDNRSPQSSAEGYFGNPSPAYIGHGILVPDLLQRTGLEYTDLLAILETQFINPGQVAWKVLQNLLAQAPSLDATNLYSQLSGTGWQTDSTFINVLQTKSISQTKFTSWLAANFTFFQQLITFYEPTTLNEPTSDGDLDKTFLHSIQCLYGAAFTDTPAQPAADAGITGSFLSRLHKFIRLWRKTGWTIHEMDNLIRALSETDITPSLLHKLAVVQQLNAVLKLPLVQLACLWGNIDTYGSSSPDGPANSLYAQLFLKLSGNVTSATDGGTPPSVFAPNLLSEILSDQPAPSVADHLPELFAALAVSALEYDAIATSAGLDGTITLENLSAIYRYKLLADQLNLSIPDLCTLKSATCFNIDPFTSQENAQEHTLTFVRNVGKLQASGFTVPILNYILSGAANDVDNIALSQDQMLGMLSGLRMSLAQIDGRSLDTASKNQLKNSQAAASLSALVGLDAAMLNAIATTVTTTGLTGYYFNNAQFTEPSALQRKDAKIDFDWSNGVPAPTVSADNFSVRWIGWFCPPANGDYTFTIKITDTHESAALWIDGKRVFSLNRTDFTDTLSGVSGQGVVASLVGGRMYPIIVEYVETTGNAGIQLLWQSAAMSQVVVDTAFLLPDTNIQALVTETGLTGYYFNNAQFTGSSALQRKDPKIDFDWGNDAPDPTVSADHFSVRWKGWFCPPANGDYTFSIKITDPNESAALWIDGKRVFSLNRTDFTDTLSGVSGQGVVASLVGGLMYPIIVEYVETAGNAGIQLLWQSDALPQAVVDTAFFFPDSVVQDLLSKCLLCHRAALFISGLSLKAEEVDYFVNNNADFGSIDFLNLRCSDWQRMVDYTTIRTIIPSNLLLPIFKQAAAGDQSTPEQTLLDRLLSKIAEANKPGWNTDYLSYLATYFKYHATDFRNEIPLLKIKEAMDLAVKTKMPVNASGLPSWTAGETDTESSVGDLHPIADQVKNAVKAKYKDNWLTIATQLNNPIRENQKHALTSYLVTLGLVLPEPTDPTLVPPNPTGRPVTDADAVYEYLLIDVQMTSTVVTSRLIQATMAVQLFADRCRLGLETEVVPGAIKPEDWDWMKHYSVAAGLKKLFVFVENYLDPSLRDDKSAFFLDFESAIRKGDITAENVENAFRDYLHKLNEVSNMEVCGMYHDTGNNILHVFARTHAAPYNYYYRTATGSASQNDSWHWAPWQQVQLDIKSIDDGDNSGVHLVPVVWKNRLVLLWPEFMEKTANSPNTSSTYSDMANTLPDENAPQKYWEVRLAWSEYANGKWTAKKVSKEVLNPLLRIDRNNRPIAPTKPRQYFFRPSFDGNNVLTMTLYLRYSGQTQYPDCPQVAKDDAVAIGTFQLTDIHEKIVSAPSQCTQTRYTDYVGPFTNEPGTGDPSRYQFYSQDEIDNEYDNGESTMFDPQQGFYDPFFQSLTDNNSLSIGGSDFLQKSINYRVLFSDDADVPSLEHKVAYSFFYTDVSGNRTYFATPLIRAAGIKMGLADRALGTGSMLDRFSARLLLFNNQVTTAIQNSPVATSGTTQQAPVVNIETPTDNTQTTNNLIVSSSNLVKIDPPNALARAQHVAGRLAFPPSFFGSNSRQPFLNGLAFYTFYHPFASVFIKKLNEKDGIAELLRADTAYFRQDPQYPNIDINPDIAANDLGTTFKDNYNPDFSVVQKYDAADSARNYYLENVDFSEYGTYSCYNWELFFHAPFLIATTLSKNGKYAEARQWFHYIFNPLSTEQPAPDNTSSPFWQFLPFKTAPLTEITGHIKRLRSGYDNDEQIDNWRKHPFNAFQIARMRTIAFMKNVVMSYLDNLIRWGDDLFLTYTRENINEATQLYVLAARILGPAPQYIPQRGMPRNYSYNNLKNAGLDDFGDAIVEFQNAFPNTSSVQPTDNSVPQNLLGISYALYFCIPPNDKLLHYWTTVGDRLFKIRHGENIDGVVVPLALYQPPIDPELLLQAKAQGLDVAAILADLESPSPLYRFAYLIQKAKEFCSEVLSLGSALLAANEKQDAEELSRLRQTQEIKLLNMVTEVKSRQVLEAQANLDNLNSSRGTALQKLSHYVERLLGNKPTQVPSTPVLPEDLNDGSSLPPETIINQVTSPIDVTLSGTNESGVKVIPKEKQEMDDSNTAYTTQTIASSISALAGIMHALPDAQANATPLGVGVALKWGGTNLGWALKAATDVLQIVAAGYAHSAGQASRMAGFIRREQDWVFQANLVVREIVQLDKQIIAAQIRLQMAQHELTNHQQQIQNAQDVEQFLETKFSKQELYQWMIDKLQDAHKQGYQLAYDMARKAEKAYRFELGIMETNFVQYGYYNGTYLGITAGEQLQLALKQMDSAYVANNVREFELTISVSLAQLDPLALLQLKETGSCAINLPEELFDTDYPGHYFRRFKSISLTIPCVAGPYTTVNSTLRLQPNSLIRIKPDPGPHYPANMDGDKLADDRFVQMNVPCTAIATSFGQNDGGMFELNFHDERYLPFEGAGVIAQLELELNGKYLSDDGQSIMDFSQFDYETISDIIIQIKYTAKEDDQLRLPALGHLKSFLKNGPHKRLFSLRHDFPTEWSAFLNQPATNGDQTCSIQIAAVRFPYLVSKYNPKITAVSLYADTSAELSDFHVISPANTDNGDFSFGPAAGPTGQNIPGLQMSNPEGQSWGDSNLGLWKIFKPGNPALTADDLRDIYLLVEYVVPIP